MSQSLRSNRDESAEWLEPEASTHVRKTKRNLKFRPLGEKRDGLSIGKSLAECEEGK